MKSPIKPWLARFSIQVLCILIGHSSAHAQGRILINEYLPWPNNACGTTAEFVELYNFGPGPVNIGGYIVTDGDYAITIPLNTVVLPGAFYVLAGQNSIPQNCGNDQRNITVNLNWNTCGCSSAPIPVSGDGFLTDGGAANEQIVLLDPALKVIDAVVRSLPAEGASIITTSSLGGLIPVQLLNLTSLVFNYETIGESMGRGNSMARRIDGGCGWIKDTQESAGDFNNTGAVLSELDASLTLITPFTCTNTGRVSIAVANALLFPINYTLAKDVDDDLEYDVTDSYQTGVDIVPANVELNALTAGRYQLVLESTLGCDLAMFNFSILACNQLALNYQPASITVANGNTRSGTIKGYPNPVSLQYQLLVESSARQTVHILLSDVTGRIVRRKDLSLMPGTNNSHLNVSDLPAGVYVLQLVGRMQERLLTERLVKQ